MRQHFFTVTTVETSNNTPNFSRSSAYRQNVFQAITKSMDNIGKIVQGGRHEISSNSAVKCSVWTG